MDSCEAEDSNTLPKHAVVISRKYTRRLCLSLKMVIIIIIIISSSSSSSSTITSVCEMLIY
jgi:hypothetical protein